MNPKGSYPHYKYSSLAERLLDARFQKDAENNKRLQESIKRNDIKIDHLAFSFPLAELRNCSRAGNAFNKVKYPKQPEFDSFKASNVEDFDVYKDNCQKVLIDFYSKCLNIWCFNVLGLELGALRGKGFHGYTDSMELKVNGVGVGFVGIGGQRNTTFFQISGSGCKHVFTHTTPFVLHHWLSKVFSVTNLSRIDLCFDDYDDNFNCGYAETAYLDEAFRISDRGQYPKIAPKHEYTINAKREKVFTQEMICVGSRTSAIYWRVYNKKLEQGIQDEKLSWYRSEVELKKWTVDSLLNPVATFSGICKFSESMVIAQGIRTKAMTPTKEACLDLAARVRHVRRSAGRALGDILEVFEGDIEKTIGLILPDDTGGKLGLPPIYQQLVRTEVNCHV